MGKDEGKISLREEACLTERSIKVQIRRKRQQPEPELVPAAVSFFIKKEKSHIAVTQRGKKFMKKCSF